MLNNEKDKGGSWILTLVSIENITMSLHGVRFPRLFKNRFCYSTRQVKCRPAKHSRTLRPTGLDKEMNPLLKDAYENVLSDPQNVEGNEVSVRLGESICTVRKKYSEMKRPTREHWFINQQARFERWRLHNYESIGRSICNKEVERTCKRKMNTFTHIALWQCVRHSDQRFANSSELHCKPFNVLMI